MPGAGVSWPTERRPTLRRVLMPNTGNHVYYQVDEATQTVHVLAIFTARNGRRGLVAKEPEALETLSSAPSLWCPYGATDSVRWRPTRCPLASTSRPARSIEDTWLWSNLVSVVAILVLDYWDSSNPFSRSLCSAKPPIRRGFFIAAAKRAKPFSSVQYAPAIAEVFVGSAVATKMRPSSAPEVAAFRLVHGSGWSLPTRGRACSCASVGAGPRSAMRDHPRHLGRTTSRSRVPTRWAGDRQRTRRHRSFTGGRHPAEARSLALARKTTLRLHSCGAAEDPKDELG